MARYFNGLFKKGAVRNFLDSLNLYPKKQRYLDKLPPEKNVSLDESIIEETFEEIGMSPDEYMKTEENVQSPRGYFKKLFKKIGFKKALGYMEIDLKGSESVIEDMEEIPSKNIIEPVAEPQKVVEETESYIDSVLKLEKKRGGKKTYFEIGSYKNEEEPYTVKIPGEKNVMVGKRKIRGTLKEIGMNPTEHEITEPVKEEKCKNYLKEHQRKKMIERDKRLLSLWDAAAEYGNRIIKTAKICYPVKGIVDADIFLFTLKTSNDIHVQGWSRNCKSRDYTFAGNVYTLRHGYDDDAVIEALKHNMLKGVLNGRDRNEVEIDVMSLGELLI